MSLHRANIDGYIISDHLGHGHGHRFRLGWIDFAGHDRRAWLIGWDIDLTDAASWSGSKQTNIVSDLV